MRLLNAQDIGKNSVNLYAKSPRSVQVYCVCVLPHGGTGPSGANIKAGKGPDGTPVPAGCFAEGEVFDGEITVLLSGLEPDTEYYVYVVLEDENGMTMPQRLTLRTALSDPTPFWNVRSPLPTVNLLLNVEPVSSGCFVLGKHGTLAYSTDGENWTSQATRTTFDLTGLTQVGEGYIAAANDGTDHSLLLTSSGDGVWHHRLLIPDALISDLIYANDCLIAIADSGKILEWPDIDRLHEYEVHQLEYDKDLHSITYADGTFIAVGMSGVVATSENGYIWTARQLSPQRNLVDVTCANGTVVAIGTGYQVDAHAYWSADKGTSWTAADLKRRGNYVSITHDGTQFVALGYGEAATWDGETDWNTSSLPALRGPTLTAAAYANGMFIRVGGHGGIGIASELDSWTYILQGTSKILNSVAWGNSCFVAIGEAGTILRSADGITWQVQDSETSRVLQRVRYLNNQFVAVGSGQTILTSPDGINWTVRNSEDTSSLLYDVAYGDGKYIAVGTGGHMFESTDGGESWLPARLGTANLHAITYGNGRFIILADTGHAYRSSNDGDEDWLSSKLLNNYSQDVVWANDRFIAIGPTVAHYSDSDGENWTRVFHGISQYIYSLAVKDGRLMAVGQNGSILRSLDNGKSWERVEFPNHIDANVYELHGITTGAENFLVVGSHGLILQSTDFGPGPDSDAQAVTADKAWLTWNVIKGDNDLTNQVTEDLNLASTGANGSTISWSADPAGYVNTDTGAVTRPDSATGDVAVTLIATISKGTASDTVTFNLVIKATSGLSADEAIAEDLAALTWDTIRGANVGQDSVTRNLNLPQTGSNGTTITWSASPTGYINTTTGAVSRPAHTQRDKTVTLTATISKAGGTDRTKDFALVVKAKEAPYVPPQDPDPEPTSVITPLVSTAADRLIDRALIDSGEAGIDLASLGENRLTISTAVLKKLAEHDLSITLTSDANTIIIDPAALLVEQISEWRKGKAWVEINVSEVVGDELEALLEQWEVATRDGRCSVHGKVYEITVTYYEAGQELGQPVNELIQALTITRSLADLDGWADELLVQLRIALAGSESGTEFVEGVYDADNRVLTFSSDRLGYLSLVLVEPPLTIIDLNIGSNEAFVNGEEKTLDVPPRLIEDRTMVPVRFVAEALGADVHWLEATRTVRIELRGEVIELVIGQADPEIGLDVPAQIISARTLVPLRFVSESLGAVVHWWPETQAVEVLMFGPPPVVSPK